MRFGVFLTPDATQPSRTLELAALADELGFDAIGVQDHPYQRRFLDTWTLLTAVAMRTSRIQVFPDVANLPLRPPAILAKSAASLDLISGGRVELGLGAGAAWDAIKAIGGAVRTPGESVAALEPIEGIPGCRTRSRSRGGNEWRLRPGSRRPVSFEPSRAATLEASTPRSVRPRRSATATGLPEPAHAGPACAATIARSSRADRRSNRRRRRPG